MKIKYDEYYQTENLFGLPYPELIAFYTKLEKKGKLLDLGCGQGRDAIALAKLGFDVTAIDHSAVGIEQLNKIADQENLRLKGYVGDIYKYSNFGAFDFILLDSIFHFGKKEREQETALLKGIMEGAQPNALITICIQKTGDKLTLLNSIIARESLTETVHTTELTYKFEDKASNHTSETLYQMISTKKL
jgi:2-polyprenyl-3-methyl-5-hydroxy-6-metoxy-1,4-benzoquinol methylase